MDEMGALNRPWFLVALLATVTLASCGLNPHPLPPDNDRGGFTGNGDASVATPPSGNDRNGSSGGLGEGSSGGTQEGADTGGSDASAPAISSMGADGAAFDAGSTAEDAAPGDGGADSGALDGGPPDATVTDGSPLPLEASLTDATADAH